MTTCIICNAYQHRHTPLRHPASSSRRRELARPRLHDLRNVQRHGGALRCRKAILALPLSATPQRLLWEIWTQRWQHFFPLRLISWQRRPHHLPRQLLLLHVHSLPSQHPSRLRQLEEVAKRLRSDLIERTSMYSVANRYAKHNKYKIYTSKRKNINQV